MSTEKVWLVLNRLYLSAVTLLIVGFTVVTLIRGREHFDELSNYRRLVEAAEELKSKTNEGLGPQLDRAVEIVQAKKMKSGTDIYDMNEEQAIAFNEASHRLGDEKALFQAVDDRYLSEANVQILLHESNFTEKILKKHDVNPFLTLNYTDHWYEYPSEFLLTIAGIVLARYWLRWLLFGRVPFKKEDSRNAA